MIFIKFMDTSQNYVKQLKNLSDFWQQNSEGNYVMISLSKGKYNARERLNNVSVTLI